MGDVNMKNKILNFTIVFVMIISFLMNSIIITENSKANILANSNFDEWTMLQKDSAHTGFTDSTAPSNYHRLWQKEYTKGKILKTPILAEGKIFFIKDAFDDYYEHDKIICLDQNGDQQWVSNVPDDPTELVYYNGNLFVGVSQVTDGIHGIYSYNAETGERNAHFQMDDFLGITSSPTFSNGRLFVVAEKPNSDYLALYCLDANNIEASPLWCNDDTIEGYSYFSLAPAVDNGKVFFSSIDSKLDLYCFDEYTGETLWVNNAAGVGVTQFTPTISDGMVYFAYDNGLFCIDSNTGEELWCDSDWLNYNEYGGPSPAIYENKLIIEGRYSTLTCYNKYTGENIWDFYSEWRRPITSSIAVADQKAYFGCEDGYFFCVNVENGEELWNTQLSDWNDIGNPSIGNGKVYVGTHNKKATCRIYCFDENFAPEIPTKPEGPSEGVIGQILTFTTNSTDPTDPYLEYLWDFDSDGEIDKTVIWISGETFEVEYQFDSSETFEVRVKARDPYGMESDFSQALIVTIGDNNKPTIPTISYETEDNIEYTFHALATDPDNDQIEYKFKIDNGQETNWVGPYESGENGSKKIKFSSSSTYEIRAKAKDIYGYEGEWSEPIEVTVPKSKHKLFLFLEKFISLFPRIQEILKLLH